MFKILKIIIMVWAVFVLFAILNNGGDSIRSLEKDTNLAVTKTLDAFAAQADNIKDQADTAKNRIKILKHKKDSDESGE